MDDLLHTSMSDRYCFPSSFGSLSWKYICRQALKWARLKIALRNMIPARRLCRYTEEKNLIGVLKCEGLISMAATVNEESCCMQV